MDPARSIAAAARVTPLHLVPPAPRPDDVALDPAAPLDLTYVPAASARFYLFLSALWLVAAGVGYAVDGAGVAVGFELALAALWALLAVPFARRRLWHVKVDGDGIAVRQGFRHRRFAWGEIERLELYSGAPSRRGGFLSMTLHGDALRPWWRVLISRTRTVPVPDGRDAPGWLATLERRRRAART